MSDTDSENALGLFQEPSDYYKPVPEATFASHTLLSGEDLRVRLVGSNPLWGHLLWNAGRTIANYLEGNAAEFVIDRTILELGAGAGLPSLVCAIRGAAQVTVTDYPDADLIENLEFNIQHCGLISARANIDAVGYLWGNPVESLLGRLSSSAETKAFDTLILADLLFNHSEHQKLLRTIELALARHEKACALVFFTPYRPWLLDKDLAFFDLARNAGFRVQQVFEKQMEEVMFEEDPGDETLRRTVFGYELRWPSPSAGKD